MHLRTDIVVVSCTAVSLRLGLSTLAPDVVEMLTFPPAPPRPPVCLSLHDALAELSTASTEDPIARVHRLAYMANAAIDVLPHKLHGHHCYRPIVVALDALQSGDFYFAFLLAVAVLERLLLRVVTGSKQSSGSKLLKDLIASPAVRVVLGDGTAAALHALFSPTLLNVRNLSWQYEATVSNSEARAQEMLCQCCSACCASFSCSLFVVLAVLEIALMRICSHAYMLSHSGFLAPCEVDRRHTSLLLLIVIRTAGAHHRCMHHAPPPSSAPPLPSTASPPPPFHATKYRGQAAEIKPPEYYKSGQ